MQEEQKSLSEEGQSLEEFKAHHSSDSYKFIQKGSDFASSSSQIEQPTVSYVRFLPSSFDRCIAAVFPLLSEKYFLTSHLCLFLVTDQYHYSLSII